MAIIKLIILEYNFEKEKTIYIMIVVILIKKFYERISLEYFLSELLFFLKTGVLVCTYLYDI
jgi:hypothetical protein